MGSKLERVIGNLEKVEETGGEAIDKAGEAVSDITGIRNLLTEIPDDGDDEILECVETVAEEATNEAADFMTSEVQAQLEQSEELGQETMEEASDQQGKSEAAAETFGGISDVRFGGRAADARGSAVELAAQFEQSIEEANTLLEQHRSAFDEAMDRVLNG